MNPDGKDPTTGAAAIPAQLRRRSLDAHPIDRGLTQDSPVFVDFDHTLFAANSTELFLATCRPGLVVAVIEFLVRGCVPWRLTGLRHWFRIRDYVCVLAVSALLPLNIPRWKRMAPALFDRHVSRTVVDALRPVAARDIVVITFGMAFVVTALLRGSEFSTAQLIATPAFAPFAYFRRGKRVLATQGASEDAVRRCTFITDSLDDEDMLTASRQAILIELQGEPARARERLYLPLRYTAAAKYTRSYVVDQIVLVELLLLLIGTSRTLHQFVAGCAFVPLLFLSIMCIYEIGYFENDMQAARLEQAPTLKGETARFQAYPILPGAWIWAFGAGALGNILACAARRTDYAPLAYGIPFWLAALIALRAVFHVYNKPDLRLRLHLYPVLQSLKFLPVLAIAPPTPAGAVLILCQIAVMWTVYQTYRHGGRAKVIERELLRVILMAAGLVLLLTARGDDAGGWSFQLAATGVWAVARLVKAPVLRRLRGSGPE